MAWAALSLLENLVEWRQGKLVVGSSNGGDAWRDYVGLGPKWRLGHINGMIYDQREVGTSNEKPCVSMVG